MSNFYRNVILQQTNGKTWVPLCNVQSSLPEDGHLGKTCIGQKIKYSCVWNFVYIVVYTSVQFSVQHRTAF